MRITRSVPVLRRASALLAEAQQYLSSGKRRWIQESLFEPRIRLNDSMKELLQVDDVKVTKQMLPAVTGACAMGAIRLSSEEDEKAAIELAFIVLARQMSKTHLRTHPLKEDCCDICVSLYFDASKGGFVYDGELVENFIACFNDDSRTKKKDVLLSMKEAQDWLDNRINKIQSSKLRSKNKELSEYINNGKKSEFVQQLLST